MSAEALQARELGQRANLVSDRFSRRLRTSVRHSFAELAAEALTILEGNPETRFPSLQEYVVATPRIPDGYRLSLTTNPELRRL
jgi:hypothetical protein